jgi:hypothetical protein
MEKSTIIYITHIKFLSPHVTSITKIRPPIYFILSEIYLSFWKRVKKKNIHVRNTGEGVFTRI